MKSEGPDQTAHMSSHLRSLISASSSCIVLGAHFCMALLNKIKDIIGLLCYIFFTFQILLSQTKNSGPLEFELEN